MNNIKKEENLATSNELEMYIYPEVIQNLGELAMQVGAFMEKLSVIKARAYCSYGLNRRIFTLKGSLERISEISPPTRTERLEENEKIDLTAHLHCYYINQSGAYNNLAWIWFHEKLTIEEKNNIPKEQVSLVNKKFKKFLPKVLVDKCSSYSEWFDYLKDFRDPLVHRIPFYVVPYMITQSEKSKYDELEKKWCQAKDSDEMEKIMNEIDNLGSYNGKMAFGYEDDKGPMTIHQVVPDANTLIEVARTFMDNFFEDK